MEEAEDLGPYISPFGDEISAVEHALSCVPQGQRMFALGKIRYDPELNAFISYVPDKKAPLELETTTKKRGE